MEIFGVKREGRENNIIPILIRAKVEGEIFYPFIFPSFLNF